MIKNYNLKLFLFLILLIFRFFTRDGLSFFLNWKFVFGFTLWKIFLSYLFSLIFRSLFFAWIIKWLIRSCVLFLLNFIPILPFSQFPYLVLLRRIRSGILLILWGLLLLKLWVSECKIIGFSLSDGFLEFLFLFLYFLLFSHELSMVMCHTDFPDCSKDEEITLSLMIRLGCVDIEKFIPESFGFLVPMEQFGRVLWKESF